MGVFDLLCEPDLRGLDLDSPQRIVLHGRILARKPMIREVFEEFYRLCRKLDETYFGGTGGRRLELGAGVSLFKHLYPDVLITDVTPADHLDAVIDAEHVGLEEGSVRALYGLNCFHHFRDPERFFRELIRVVRPGGGCILVEPYHGPLASVVYKRLFRSETFEKAAPGWEGESSGGGAMVGANQAASYVVFVRDRERFTSLFPELQLVYARPLGSFLRYVLSGGLNFRPLVPAGATPLLLALEALLQPLAPLLALHQVLVVVRRSGAGQAS
jgi:SAM-dependent methyltransferase